MLTDQEKKIVPILGNLFSFVFSFISTSVFQQMVSQAVVFLYEFLEFQNWDLPSEIWNVQNAIIKDWLLGVDSVLFRNYFYYLC